MVRIALFMLHLMSVYFLASAGAMRPVHFSSKSILSGNGRCLFTKAKKLFLFVVSLTIQPSDRNLNLGNKYSEQHFITFSEQSRSSSVHLYVTRISRRFPLLPPACAASDLSFLTSLTNFSTFPSKYRT